MSAELGISIICAHTCITTKPP